MATANWKRRRHALPELDDTSPMEATAPRPSRRRPLRLRFWTVTLLLLTLTLWFAPTIVAHTPLLDQVLASMAGDLRGTVTAESASLGWLSPVTLGDVHLRDDKNETVLRATSIEGTQPLWKLLFDGQNLGHFRLSKPELHIVLTKDGTNVEQVLGSFLGDIEDASSTCPALRIEFEGGALAIVDKVGERHWRVEELKVDAALARDWAQPFKLAVEGKLPQPDRTATCNISLDATRIPRDGASPASEGSLSLQSSGLPLSIVETILRRQRPELALSGWLSSKVKLTWKPGRDGRTLWSVDGEIETEKLALTDAALGNDQLRLERVRIPARGTFDGQHIMVGECAAYTDMGELKLIGPVTLPADAALGESLIGALESGTYALSGHLDLARLTAVLPETLRLRHGTEITSGQVTLDFSCSHGKQTAWQGRIETSNLVATHDKRSITWKKPLSVVFNAHDSDAGVVIDRLVCDSKFLEIEAAGQFDQLSASAIYDLNKLAEELGQFIDFRGIELSGDGWSYITWKRDVNGRFEADGEFQVRQFRLAAPEREPWTEENLVMIVALTGQAKEQRLTQLDKATLTLDSEPDKLTAKLLEPVRDISAKTSWPIALQATGKLATWTTRLRPVLGDLEGWKLAGDCKIEGRGKGSADGIQIDELHGDVAQFQAIGHSFSINEPQAKFDLAATWTPATRQLQLPILHLVSSTLSVEGKDVLLALPQNQPPRVAGVLTYSGDINRLQQWTFDPAQPSLWSFAGRLQGQVEITPVDDRPLVVNAKIDTQLDELVGTRPGADPWRQPQIRLVGTGSYDRNKGDLAMDRMQITSTLINCDAGGQLTDIAGRRDLTLSGQLDYDPKKLLALIEPYLGEGIKIAAARESRPFSFSGPLSALSTPPAEAGAQGAVAAIDRLYREFEAQAAFGWTGAEVYGFRVASGELRGKLADGMLLFQPLNLSVSDGRLTASPSIRFWPEPKELLLPRGPLLSQVRISPEMCDRALKYIAPVLAGVTQAEGKFSVALDGCRVPLDRPATGELAGQFTVHSVEIGAGPLVRELAVVLDRPGIARLSRESVVPFRMVEGRVYHRDLELVFPDVTIRTHGSVGLDQSLAIMAEMPVPPKWIGNNPLGSVIKNQTIRLPIGGTLRNPQIDRQALAQVSAEFLRGSATNLLRDTLNKQLDRFFTPPKQQP